MFLGFSLFQVTQWITAAGMSLGRYMKTILRVEHQTNPISEQVFFKQIISLGSLLFIIIKSNENYLNIRSYNYNSRMQSQIDHK